MTLIYAAKEGDLDSVRAFNSKGLGLWEYACYDQDFNFYHHRTWPHIQQEMKVIDIPKTREDATRMFKTLLYGRVQPLSLTHLHRNILDLTGAWSITRWQAFPTTQKPKEVLW